ncbi:SpoIIE family protein phosphatase [Candidatus Protochlamydia phocaeensis]|uniref:SpoIIE family protein phosphatase n=1 Tax=Candidatus Protochlamydia phocaeensis TaxID=1414722 RepID=UPI000839463E|nr:SpoIIE family protein phosphatase [Candidatus Protochlamydia phocaeensis]
MKKEKLLIINDDENIRDILTLFLKEKQYEVIEAEDGFSGMEQAVKASPDLILLDIVMPGLNGYQVCEQLKQNPLTKDIPVIFLSSLTQPMDKIQGLEMGGVDFITRASDKGELLARVQTHLKISALSKELKEKNAELVEKQKYLDEDLQVAASIQSSLLPSKQLKINDLDINWVCSPCNLVGGDIFNIIPINEALVAFYILDVSGHGVHSAMVAVSISQFFHQYSGFLAESTINKLASPKAIMDELNKEFPFERFNEFFTIFYMVLNVQTRALSYTSGGHPPAILLHCRRQLELLSGEDSAIGINPVESACHAETIFLEEGDKIVLYTDGIIEYSNQDCDLYGEERFCALLESVKHRSSAEIVEAVCLDLKAFSKDKPPLDDISLMVIGYHSPRKGL